jgi:hypothetical protein
MKYFMPLILVIIMGCESPQGGVAPSDYELDQARIAMNNGEPGARVKYAQMKLAREKADAVVDAGGGLLNMIIPGAGALVALGYGLWQRRGKVQAIDAVDVATQAIENNSGASTKDVKAQLKSVANPVINKSAARFK